MERADDQNPATTVAASTVEQKAPTSIGVKRKLIRGGIALAVRVAVVVVGLLPALSARQR